MQDENEAGKLRMNPCFRRVEKNLFNPHANYRRTAA
jgi:hypothetical protein